MADENLHAKHRARMQERVERDGLDSLAEHEALEYLLFLSIPRADTNALAHRLIQHFGDFCKVLEAEPEELMQVEGAFHLPCHCNSHQDYQSHCRTQHRKRSSETLIFHFSTLLNILLQMSRS